MTLSDITHSIDEALANTPIDGRPADTVARCAIDHINNLLRQDAIANGAREYRAIVLGDRGDLQVGRFRPSSAAPTLSD